MIRRRSRSLAGKLLTGVTLPQWSAILMLNNLESPESYFQAAFRVQSPWSLWNPDGADPNEEKIVKAACLVLDFRTIALSVSSSITVCDWETAQMPTTTFENSASTCRSSALTERGCGVDVNEIIDTAFQTTNIDTRRMQSKRFIHPNASKLELLSEDVRQALTSVTTQRSDGSDDDANFINETPELKNREGKGGSGAEELTTSKRKT